MFISSEPREFSADAYPSSLVFGPDIAYLTHTGPEGWLVSLLDHLPCADSELYIHVYSTKTPVTSNRMNASILTSCTANLEG